LSESRCLAYNPEAKERVVEKAVSRLSSLVFDSKLARHSTQDAEESSDVDWMIFQYSEFRQLMRAESHVEVRSDESEDEEGQRSAKRKLSESEGEE
jgi:hypothetical protein